MKPPFGAEKRSAGDRIVYVNPAYEDQQRVKSVFERQVQGNRTESEYRIRTPESGGSWRNRSAKV